MTGDKPRRSLMPPPLPRTELKTVTDEAPTPRISEIAPVYARGAQELALDLSTAVALYPDARELPGLLARAKAYSCGFLTYPQAPPRIEESRAAIAAFLAFHQDTRALLALLA